MNNIVYWDSTLTQVKNSLTFKGLDHSTDDLIFFCETENRQKYKVISNPEIYTVSLSESFIHYEFKLGVNCKNRTFIIENSKLLSLYKDDINIDYLKHYLIMTDDAAIDIISMFQPRICKVNN